MTLDLMRLRVKVFADGADVSAIEQVARRPYIRGFTTNPTLMRAAGVTDYRAFANRVLTMVPALPVCFEVLADEPAEMLRQARNIAGWGENAYVKIPVTDTRGRSSAEVIHQLSAEGVKLNVTAMTTADQVRHVVECLRPGTPAIVSVFAGRIADTGRDPVPIIRACLEILQPRPEFELLWASPRELLNIVQADQVGCHIITVTHDLLQKIDLLGKDLDEFSLDTVRMFHRDAGEAGYQL